MLYLIGSGYMAKEYAKVLLELKQQFTIIGRGEQSAQDLREELKVEVVTGGISHFLTTDPVVPSAAIVCTPVETLSSITDELLDFGVKNILIEKPGALSVEELSSLEKKADKLGANVYIGYNRRFYQSTLALKERLKSEQLIATNFEITEWSHVIVKEPCSSIVKNKWILANTSHVIDLVMDVVGPIKELSTYSAGTLDWHESAARFVGSGVAENGVLISYFGYWDGPGRWSAEFVTQQNRYIFRPMEKLQVQPTGSIHVNQVEGLDYRLDEEFKPGLYLQTLSFINGDYTNLCSLGEQLISFEVYNQIANY